METLGKYINGLCVCVCLLKNIFHSTATGKQCENNFIYNDFKFKVFFKHQQIAETEEEWKGSKSGKWI